MQLQITRAGKNSRLWPSTPTVANFIFELDGSDFLASYSRTLALPRQSDEEFDIDLLTDIVASEKDIADFSNIDVSIAVILLLPGSNSGLAIWQAWMERLHLQAIQSIRQENVLCETWFSFRLQERVFLIAAMLRPCNIAAEENGSTPDLEIDRHHRAFKACWDKTHRIVCIPMPRENQNR